MLFIAQQVISGALLLIGALDLLLAAIGLLRMPDLFLRMSATSKASSLGTACILLAVAISTAELSVTVRALAGLIFLYLTAPVAAHMIGRVAYLIGVPLWKGTVIDELNGCYDVQRDILYSSPESREAADRGRAARVARKPS